MERPLKNTLFIEFYGLPGSGKSTISHLVSEVLRSKGCSVDEPSYDIDRNFSPFFRKLIKIHIFFFWLIFHNKTFQKVSAIVVKNGYSGISMIEQASNVLQKISVYKNNKQDRIIIWDQGLVQASISLSLKGKINACENLKNLLNILDSDIQMLNFQIFVDEEVALERMSNRPTNDSRVEKLKDDCQKHEMLSRFQNEIDSVKEKFDVTIIDGTTDIEKQVDLIVETIVRLC